MKPTDQIRKGWEYRSLNAATLERRSLTFFYIGPGDEPNSFLTECPNPVGRKEVCHSTTSSAK